MTGTVVALHAVSDPVFNAGLVGPGIAVAPHAVMGAAVTAPIAGTVLQAMPHAFIIAGDDGRAVLTHLGIDTVELQGDGFTLHVAVGDRVEAGQLVTEWNPAAVAATGRSTLSPVIALDTPADLLVDTLAPSASVTAGSCLFRVLDS